MRLCRAGLASLPPAIRRPAYDLDAVRIGVVHLGPGAFHRVHQACYLDDLLETDPRWGVSAVSLRSPGVRDALQPQDGLYTVAELEAETRLRVVGAIRELLVAPAQPEAVLDRLASPQVRLVTLTITEKGYCLTPDGALDLDHPDVRADLAGGPTPSSAPGWLVAGLRRRRDAGAGGLTLLSCDNLQDNGARLRRAVLDLAVRQAPGLARWIEAEVRFPSSMVDSITPATDDALRARVAAALGCDDAWPVQREAFRQWVVEDDLGPDAPDLSAVGVQLTSDVASWERAKLRLLNGAHSTLAYAGLLRGHETVADAMADPPLAAAVERMMREDVIPTLAPTPGLDPHAYVSDVLARFRNPAIRHLLSQIAWDGSQKLPFRVLGTTADALAAGRTVDRLALPVAAWMRFVVARVREGVPLVDPLAEPLGALARRVTGGSDDVGLFLAEGRIFPPALAAAAPFRDAVTDAYARLPDLPRA